MYCTCRVDISCWTCISVLVKRSGHSSVASAATGLGGQRGRERRSITGEERDLLVILANERGSAVLKVLRLKVKLNALSLM